MPLNTEHTDHKKSTLSGTNASQQETGLPPQTPEQELQLEQELLTLWRQAANTRKSTSNLRIERIMRNSRSELAMRDLFMFAIHVVRAFLSLFGTTLNALFNTRETDTPTPTHTDPDPNSAPDRGPLP